jgi:hypothetical protein
MGKWPGLLVGLALVSPHASAAAPSAQAQLIRLEQTWLEAAEHHDVAALRRILSESYIDINYKGVVRHKADALRAPNVRARGYEQRLGEERVRLFGDTAIVTGRGELRNSRSQLLGVWRFTDVFVRRGGGWRVVSSQETPVIR